MQRLKVPLVSQISAKATKCPRRALAPCRMFSWWNRTCKSRHPLPCKNNLKFSQVIYRHLMTAYKISSRSWRIWILRLMPRLQHTRILVYERFQRLWDSHLQPMKKGESVLTTRRSSEVGALKSGWRIKLCWCSRRKTEPIKLITRLRFTSNLT